MRGESIFICEEKERERERKGGGGGGGLKEGKR